MNANMNTITTLPSSSSPATRQLETIDSLPTPLKDEILEEAKHPMTKTGTSYTSSRAVLEGRS